MGRTDFELATPGERTAYVEVQSNTYAVDCVSMFPDRATERGQRHLRELAARAREGVDFHVVFVLHCPDVDRPRPFRAVDPAAAALLGDAAAAGVEVSAIATRFDPPTVRPNDAEVPVVLG